MSSRGKNFTEREKSMLLELVQKYKHIIENKCTNAITTIKKNQTWEAITTEFNSTSETPRTQKQLNTAYLNLKRTTRQNVANENVKRYLQQRDDTNIINDIKIAQAGTSQIITINEPNKENDIPDINNLLRQFKRDEIADKKAIRATGGGPYTPVLSSVGAQMLAVMGDQVKPLQNTCDSASNYYKNDEPVIIADIIPLTDEAEHSNLQNNNDDIPPCTKPIFITKVKNRRKLQHTQQATKKFLAKNNEVLKRKYYQTKLESAVIDKKTKLLEYKLMLRKQKLLDLEIKIKEKEYENLHSK